MAILPLKHISCAEALTAASVAGVYVSVSLVSTVNVNVANNYCARNVILCVIT